MKALKWTLGMTAVVAFTWWALPAQRPITQKQIETGGSFNARAQGAVPAPTSLGAGARTQAARRADSYSDALKRATDYWEFAHSILPAAKAGNPDAQLALYEIHMECTYARSPKPDQDGNFLSLEQSVKKAAMPPCPRSEVMPIRMSCFGWRLRVATLR